MRTQQRHGNGAGGFTVIEIMIVLVIAAMMLTFILEILPTLTRTGRNNNRKQDVSTILEAVSHWELSNSGNLPHTGDNYLQYSTLNFYATTNVTIHSDSAGAPSHVGASNNTDNVDIYNYQKCDPANPGGSTAVAAGYSDVVALFAIETSGGPSGRCQQL